MSLVLSSGRNGKQKTNKQTNSFKRSASKELNNKRLFSKDVQLFVMSSCAERRKNSTSISKIEFVLCGDKCSSSSFVLHVRCIRLDKARKYGIMRLL